MSRVLLAVAAAAVLVLAAVGAADLLHRRQVDALVAEHEAVAERMAERADSLEREVARAENARQQASAAADSALARYRRAREALAAIDVTRVSHVDDRAPAPADLFPKWGTRGGGEPAPATADSLGPLPVVDPEAVRRALAAGDTLAEACTLLRSTCDRAVAERDSLIHAQQLRVQALEQIIAAERRRRPSVWHDVRSVAVGVAVGVVASSLLK